MGRLVVPPGDRPGKRLRSDPVFYAELAYCVPRGIPHSVFLGRVVGPRDPQWNDHDSDAALAFVQLEALRCPRCGTREEEWDEAQGGDFAAYFAAPHTCPGCVNLSMAERMVDKNNSAGVSLRLYPKDHPMRQKLIDMGAREAQLMAQQNPASKILGPDGRPL